MKINKYSIALTGIYIALVLLYWFLYSHTLLVAIRTSAVFLRVKTGALITLPVFILLGIFTTLMKKKNNKMYSVVHAIAFIICIALTVLLRSLIGTNSYAYIWFSVISFLYGHYLAYC